MRIFEILILFTLLGSVVFTFVKKNKRPKWVFYLPSVNLFFLLLHLLIEGYRMQMFPAYLLMIIFFSTNLRAVLKPVSIENIISSKRLIALRFAGATFALLFYSVAVFLPNNIPLFKVPEPTGTYKIGTKQLAFINNTREETWTKEEGDFPNISARVWYPAKSVEDYKKAGYMKSSDIVFSYLNHVKTNSYWDAEISDSENRFPILIFGHGGGGFNVQNTIQMEELASHGYIVFSLGHAYESAVCNYPDGTYIKNSWEGMEPQIREMNKAGRITKVLRHYYEGDTLTLSERKKVMRKVHSDCPVELSSLRRWAADTRFFMDELEKMNKDKAGVFSRKMDLDKIGIFGMSFGGATAIHTGIHDNRIKAVIDFDGYAFGDVIDEGLEAPVMLFSNQYAVGRDEVIYLQAQQEAYSVSINGARHANFNDSYLWMKSFRPFFIGTLGTIEPERMNTILNSYTLSFFNKHLKGKDNLLLDSETSEFPEVDFRSQNTDNQ